MSVAQSKQNPVDLKLDRPNGAPALPKLNTAAEGAVLQLPKLSREETLVAFNQPEEKPEKAKVKIDTSNLKFEAKSLESADMKVMLKRYVGAAEYVLEANPDLEKVLSRKDLKIVVVDDVYAAMKTRFGVDISGIPNVAGYSQPEVDANTGKSTGTTMFLSSSLFKGVAPTPTVQIFTLLDHELHVCSNGSHPPAGEVPKIISRPEQERMAYKAGIADLGKISEKFEARVKDEPWLGQITAQFRQSEKIQERYYNEWLKK